VVHGHNDGFPRISIHDPFHADRFADVQHMSPLWEFFTTKHPAKKLPEPGDA
jgi:hypothetical protein